MEAPLTYRRQLSHLLHLKEQVRYPFHSRGWHKVPMRKEGFAMGDTAQTQRATVELVTLVSLDRDHPGFRDQVYRDRRNSIARTALQFDETKPIPIIEYTEDENTVWTTVCSKLGALHARFACREYLDGFGKLPLAQNMVPQLAHVSERLHLASGFRMLPVAGLVTSKHFLSQLSRKVFLSTQYIRHSSRPLYTPEPDLIHEVVGHAASLCNPHLAALNQMFGQVATKAPDERIVELERLYWYTVEFGTVLENGKPKAFGAGLLSSFGELGRFATEAFLRPFDVNSAIEFAYDPTDYQKTLYFVPSLAVLMERLDRYFVERY
jgi:phenylalanine-4-hydroxylase